MDYWIVPCVVLATVVLLEGIALAALWYSQRTLQRSIRRYRKMLSSLTAAHTTTKSSLDTALTDLKTLDELVVRICEVAGINGHYGGTVNPNGRPQAPIPPESKGWR